MEGLNTTPLDVNKATVEMLKHESPVGLQMASGAGITGSKLATLRLLRTFSLVKSSDAVHQAFVQALVTDRDGTHRPEWGALIDASLCTKLVRGTWAVGRGTNYINYWDELVVPIISKRYGIHVIQHLDAKLGKLKEPSLLFICPERMYYASPLVIAAFAVMGYTFTGVGSLPAVLKVVETTAMGLLALPDSHAKRVQLDDLRAAASTCFLSWQNAYKVTLSMCASTAMRKMAMAEPQDPASLMIGKAVAALADAEHDLQLVQQGRGAYNSPYVTAAQLSTPAAPTASSLVAAHANLRPPNKKQKMNQQSPQNQEFSQGTLAKLHGVDRTMAGLRFGQWEVQANNIDIDAFLRSGGCVACLAPNTAENKRAAWCTQLGCIAHPRPPPLVDADVRVAKYDSSASPVVRTIVKRQSAPNSSTQLATLPAPQPRPSGRAFGGRSSTNSRGRGAGRGRQSQNFQRRRHGV